MNNEQEKKVIPSTPNYYSNYLKGELRKKRDERLFDEVQSWPLKNLSVSVALVLVLSLLRS